MLFRSSQNVCRVQFVSRQSCVGESVEDARLPTQQGSKIMANRPSAPLATVSVDVPHLEQRIVAMRGADKAEEFIFDEPIVDVEDE